MKYLLPLVLLPTLAFAEDNPELAEKIGRHQEGARDLSDEQDELAADVQQLTIEQTHPKVIEMFRAVEDAMDDASELLYEHDTGGETIAAETDVIEKIYEAAKERQKQCSGGNPSSPGGAMMEMMERMMGKQPGGQKPGDKPGDQGGEGMTGDSDAANEGIAGSAEGKVEERRVPKGAGTAGKGLPGEFRDALKAYNRGAEKLVR
ncbi:hypothetical protein HAHE_36400 [Haloferula helveola]|uniref:Uncharacterized protein n=1 Tax=Haloferula helveola TaxID=490095 RepID=A0ABN6HB71_9BACT|nr:hypothetical protein HAHE_36400 [Haloferula helveola]